MFDGKKVLKGGDVELLGLEEEQTLECIGHAKFTLEFKGDKDVEDPVKMSLSFFGPDINRMKQLMFL
jgi:hypothetical protein